MRKEPPCDSERAVNREIEERWLVHRIVASPNNERPETQKRPAADFSGPGVN